MNVYVNAARLDRALRPLSNAQGLELLATLFPELSEQRRRLMQEHWDEIKRSGSRLTMPASWDSLLGDCPVTEENEE